jgi:hypothetical protein
MTQEMAEHLELVETAQEHFLVIAAEDADAPARLPLGARAQSRRRCRGRGRQGRRAE